MGVPAAQHREQVVGKEDLRLHSLEPVEEVEDGLQQCWIIVTNSSPTHSNTKIPSQTSQRAFTVLFGHDLIDDVDQFVVFEGSN